MIGFDIAGVNGAGIITRALAGDFIIVKATEGRGFDDPLHDQFVARARAAGKRVGHYHYAWPENGGTVDATHFLARAGAQSGDLVALDFEPFRTMAAVDAWGQYVVDFARTVHDALGVWPLLYSEDFHLRRLSTTPEFDWIRSTLPLWKAGVNNAYTGDPNNGPGDTYGFALVAAYQWSDAGIDSDLFYCDWDQLAVGGGSAGTQPASSSLVAAGIPLLMAAAAFRAHGQ